MAGRRLSVVIEPPVIALCAGKDCRTQGGFAKLRDTLDARCAVVDLKCVGVCSGPVVAVVEASGNPTVYSKVRGKQCRSMLLALLDGDARAKRGLAKRRVTKKKVAGLVMRQMKRRSGALQRAA